MKRFIGYSIVAITLAACGGHASRATAEATSPAADPATAASAPAAPAQLETAGDRRDGAPAAPLDGRVRAAARLANRALPTPTPQQVNLQRGAKSAEWDRERYLADPAAYLDIAAPGRAYEPAQPAADVPMLQAAGAQHGRIAPGGSIVLQALTEPGMPVTFASPGLGSFDSGVPTITVAADEHGLASARFSATPGVVGPCPIIAASPVRGGDVRYFVTVSER